MIEWIAENINIVIGILAGSSSVLIGLLWYAKRLLLKHWVTPERICRFTDWLFGLVDKIPDSLSKAKVAKIIIDGCYSLAGKLEGLREIKK